MDFMMFQEMFGNGLMDNGLPSLRVGTSVHMYEYKKGVRIFVIESIALDIVALRGRKQAEIPRHQT